MILRLSGINAGPDPERPAAGRICPPISGSTTLAAHREHDAFDARSRKLRDRAAGSNTRGEHQGGSIPAAIQRAIVIDPHIETEAIIPFHAKPVRRYAQPGSGRRAHVRFEFQSPRSCVGSIRRTGNAHRAVVPIERSTVTVWMCFVEGPV